MRVPPALGTATHIVLVINPFDVEWDVLPALDKCQLPAWVADLGQVNDPAVDNSHWTPVPSLRSMIQSLRVWAAGLFSPNRSSTG